MFSPAILTRWCLDQQHQHHLEAIRNTDSYLHPRPESDPLQWVQESHVFNKSSRCV